MFLFNKQLSLAVIIIDVLAARENDVLKTCALD